MTYIDFGMEWDVLDFFAGKARISHIARAKGYKAAAFDVDLASAKRKRKSIWRASRSPMDINSDAGFLSHVCNTMTNTKA